MRPLLCAPCPASFSKTSRGRATCFAGFSRYGRQQTEGPNERGSAQNRTPLRLKISNKGFVQRLGEKGGGKDAPGAGTDGDSAFAAMRAACGACRFLSRACAVLLLFPVSRGPSALWGELQDSGDPHQGIAGALSFRAQGRKQTAWKGRKSRQTLPGSSPDLRRAASRVRERATFERSNLAWICLIFGVASGHGQKENSARLPGPFVVRRERRGPACGAAVSDHQLRLQLSGRGPG